MFDIRNSMRASFQQFNAIRHMHAKDFPPDTHFWDIVVLTASNNDQKEAFEAQLRGKISGHEIPSGIGYHVFSDPVGPRTGCGGGTMLAVTELESLYSSEELKKKYILLINAGGWSQRLPSTSVLGKVFMALPIAVSAEFPNWQVLELKLACYLPLRARMKPGYLHVASDTIEVWYIGHHYT